MRLINLVQKPKIKKTKKVRIERVSSLVAEGGFIVRPLTAPQKQKKFSKQLDFENEPLSSPFFRNTKAKNRVNLKWVNSAETEGGYYKQQFQTKEKSWT